MTTLDTKLREGPAVAPYAYPRDEASQQALQGQRRIWAKWRERRATLHARTQWPREDVAAWQLERLSTLADLAYMTHPFYHELYHKAGFRPGDLASWGDYTALPSVSKLDIMAAWDAFGTSRLLPVAECYTARTSGSSGRTLTIVQDSGTNDAGTLFYFRHYEQMLGRARHDGEWLYEIYLVPPRFTSFNGTYPVFTVSNACPLDVAVAHMRHLRPAILSTFPSYLNHIAGLGLNLSTLGVKAVCTHSEGSTQAEREAIARAFDAPVCDEYSSEELYLIATQCREGHYHIVEDNVRVDVLSPDPDGVGEIVATSLTNTFMPFIRYRQGDVIQLREDGGGCACGNCFRQLGRFHGRADQVLKTRAGGVVMPDRIMTLYDHTLIPKAAGIAEFQIVQTQHGVIDLLVVPEQVSGTYDSAHMERFHQGLKAIFDDPLLALCVTLVAQMPAGLSHKRRLITCKL